MNDETIETARLYEHRGMEDVRPAKGNRRRIPEMRKSDLSPGFAQLFGIMSRLDFGWIEQLHVRDGQPLLDPPPRVVKKYKLGSRNDPRPETERADFVLKKEHAEFFFRLSQLGTCVVKRIEVRHGLPFSMVVEEVVRA